MMKNVLIAGVVALGAMGIAGVAAANGPCAPATGLPYSVCLLQDSSSSSSFTYNYGSCGTVSGNHYSWSQSSDNNQLANGNVNGVGVSATQNHNGFNQDYSFGCGYSSPYYSYSYLSKGSYQYTDKDTNIGTTGLPAHVGLDQNLASGASSYTYNYAYNCCPNGYNYASNGGGSSNYDSKSTMLGASAPFVGASAGQSQSDSSYNYNGQGTYNGQQQYKYSSTGNSSDFFTGVRVNAGPESVQAGQWGNSYANSYSYASQYYNYNYAYAYSQKNTGVSAAGFFTGQQTTNGSCSTMVLNQNAGACPQEIPTIGYMVPEIPNFPTL